MAERFTKDEEHACLQMVRQGMCHADIAEALGRDQAEVTYLIQKRHKQNPHSWRKFGSGKMSNQPCPDCYYGSGAIDPVTQWKCPWADRLEPLPDWIATENYIQNQSGEVVYYTGSYMIHHCPHYVFG